MTPNERRAMRQLRETAARLVVHCELLERRLSTAADKQILLLNKLIDCEQQTIHLNTPSTLPPVGCPLLIEIAPGRLVNAERTGYLLAKGSDMEYRVSDGNVINGRFRWTYP